jgi:copper(I)-binding protein
MQVLKNVALYATVFFISLTSNVGAHEHKQEKGKVTIENAWARSTFALAKTGAVYLSINNQSQHDIKLLSVNVDSSVADDAQLHETLMTDEMMQMREAEDGFELPSGEMLEFEPGAKHIMLMGLKQPLKAGDEFFLSLMFEKNKVLRVPIKVKDAR